MIEKVRGEIELMQRHIEVLRTVVAHQPIGRYSLRVLEQMGYIRASSSGAVATEQAQDLLANLNTELEAMEQLLESMKQE